MNSKSNHLLSSFFLLLALLLPSVTYGQSMSTKGISESTTIQSVDNTITFTLRPSVALLTGDVITITGLTGTQTNTNNALSVGGGGAASFGSAADWTKGAGTLVLTATAGIPDNADTVITIVLTNKATSQSPVTPTIAVSGSVAIGSSNMAASVLGAATAQTFTAKTVAESSTVQDADNLLTFTVRPNVALSAGDTITIAGLTGSQTGNSGALTVSGTDAAVFGSSGSWTQSTGTLVLTVAGGQTVPNNANTVVTATIINGGSSQGAQTPTIAASGSASISSSSMSSGVLSASTSRPTIGSMSPNRMYKASATTVTFTAGAGTLASGDVISVRTDCTNAGSAVATGTLDGSDQTALTIANADAVGKKVCYQDNTNGFTTFVDSGLTLPVVELTGLSPGTSSTAGTVGVGVATTITLSGTGASTADRIKFVASGSNCAASPVSGGGAYTLLTSGTTTSVTLTATTSNAKICYDPSSSGFYTDTTLTLTSVVTEITAVNVEKVVKSNTVSYTFTGTGLHTHAYVKIHASSCSGSGSSGVNGGTAQQLSSITNDRTQATLSFSLNTAGTNYKICLLVSGGAYAGSGTYSQPASLEVDVADITSRSSSQIGTYVTTTMTIAGTGLTNQDIVRLANGNCNTAVTNAEATLTDATSFDITPHASQANAKICLKVFDSKRADEGFVDTGLTVNIAPSEVTNVAGSRVAKGQAVTYTFTGFGLGTHVKVKIIASTSTCSGNSDTANIITGGDGKVLANPSADGTSATASFTLTQADSDAVNAKICVLVPSTNYLGSNAYAMSSNNDVVTVVSIDSRSPAQVGLYVVTQLTLTGNGLTSSDQIALGTTNCATPVTNVNDISLTSSVAVDVEARSTRANALLCLLVSDSERTPAYKDTGLTITTATTSISSVDVDKVVKGDVVTFTFSGFGLDSHVKIKVIQSGSTCSGTDHTSNIITGGGQGGGFTLSSTTTAKTAATLSLTLNEAQTNAKICFLVANTNYGGTDAYTDTGGSDVLTVMELTGSSPSQIGLYVATRFTLTGSDLTTGDFIALSTSTNCNGNWVTNAHDINLLSATTVAVTPQSTGSAKICMRAVGSSVYHYTGQDVIVAAPTINSISPTKVAKGDAIAFTFNGYGLGTFIKAKVVTSGTGCSGTSDTSTITGGGGVSLTVTDPGEKTSGTHTFTLDTAADNAIMCILVPSANYGGSNAYATFSLQLDIIEISATSPSNAGTNIQFYLYFDTQVALTTSDTIKIGTSSGACAGGDSTNIVAGGDGASVTYSGGYRTQFQLTAAHTNALICIKVDGSSAYHATGQTLTIGAPVINSRDDSSVASTVANTFTFSGYGLDSNIKVKFVNTACNANTNDADDVITGGNGVALSGNNAKTTTVSKSFTLNTAAVAAKICILIPSTSGGSGSYSDTGLVVEIRGRARYLVIQTTGYGFLAGSSPVAATTPFVVKISRNQYTSGIVSTDEQHGVVSVVATILYDPQTVGSAATLSGTTTITLTNQNGVLTWTDLKINYWATNFRLRFTATTLTGTTMTSTTVDSSSFIVGGIAKSLQLFTPPSGCVASIACTTQPVIKVLDGGGSVLDDKYSGVQTITASVQDDTGCEHADSVYTNQETITAGTTCTVSTGVCTFSGQTLETWALNLIIRYTATTPTDPVHTMTSNIKYVDTSGFTVKGTASKIVLTFDTSTWVASKRPQTFSKPYLTAPRIEVQDSSSNIVTDSCVSGIPKVMSAITAGTSNGGSITSGTGTFYRYTGVSTLSYMQFTTYMSNIVITFTASAPAHFADLTAGTQVTTAFDVYALMYSRKLTLEKFENYEDSKNGQSTGTLQVATP